MLALIAGFAGVLRAENSAAPLFDDPVIARGKGIEVRRSQLEDAVIQFKANLAVRGQTLSESQRTTREAQLLDRLIITQILLARATTADRAKAKEFAEKFTTESKKMASSDEMFFRQIKALGLSQEQFQKRVDEQAIAEAVLDRELKSTITIADSQIEGFYKSGVDWLVNIMQEDPFRGKSLGSSSRWISCARQIWPNWWPLNRFGSFISLFPRATVTPAIVIPTEH